MIEAAIVFSGARLARRAAMLAEAHAETVRRTDPLRWRLPRLLWPLFAQKIDGTR
jgi:hypothetical protein